MIYLPPSLCGFVNKRAVLSTWTDHVSFGYDLVEALRPRLMVELGTQAGMSYFCFCQAVREHGLSTRCRAVDTWAGDEHTREYDENVYRDVSEYNAAHYADFSELLRTRFEDAVDSFENGSIDLLHIDGLHTYEAVRADFEAWYPKVASGGVILMHDIAARIMDFGAWRFWDEIAKEHRSFAFLHGFGLGVLRKAGDSSRSAPLLELLFSGDEDVTRRLRAFYIHASRHLDMLRWREMIEELQKQLQEQQRARDAEQPS